MQDIYSRALQFADLGCRAAGLKLSALQLEGRSFGFIASLFL